MTRSHHVKKSRKTHTADNGDKIPVGTSYYWWKVNFKPTVHKSLTPPKQSQLVNSPFLSQVYGLGEQYVWGLFEASELEERRDELCGDIECLRDECEESLSQMPEHLHDTSFSGELLTERVEMLDQWKDELECISLDDPPELADYEKSEGSTAEENHQDALDGWLEDKIDELEGCEYQGS